MKAFIQLILLVFSIASFGQTQKTTTIQLLPALNWTNIPYSWRGDTVLFYKMPEDSISFRVFMGQYWEGPIKLYNIPISPYKMVFKNNFRQVVAKEIQLTDQSLNIIRFSPDSLLDYPQNTLPKLQDNDSIVINFTSNGCFHENVSKIVISRMGRTYFARLSSVTWGNFTRDKETKRLVLSETHLKNVVLTAQNLRDFARFENELNFVGVDGGCTTVDSYEVRSKYLYKLAGDVGCDWNGFYFLRKSFFGERE